MKGSSTPRRGPAGMGAQTPRRGSGGNAGAEQYSQAQIDQLLGLQMRVIGVDSKVEGFDYLNPAKNKKKAEPAAVAKPSPLAAASKKPDNGTTASKTPAPTKQQKTIARSDSNLSTASSSSKASNSSKSPTKSSAAKKALLKLDEKKDKAVAAVEPTPPSDPAPSAKRFVPRKKAAAAPVEDAAAEADTEKPSETEAEPAPKRGPAARLALLKSKLKPEAPVKASAPEVDDDNAEEGNDYDDDFDNEDDGETPKKTVKPKAEPQKPTIPKKGETVSRVPQKAPKKVDPDEEEEEVEAPPPKKKPEPPKKKPVVEEEEEEEPENDDDEEEEEEPKEEVIPPGMNKCPDCGRKFNDVAYEKHVKICKKVFMEKRKAYDSKSARVDNMPELLKPKPIKKGGKKGAASAESKAAEDAKKAAADKAAKWKADSEAFRQAMKAARTGGTAPPAPSQPDPSLVQCPHCKRRFNDAAAEKHIPKCPEKDKRPAAGGRGGRR